MDETTYAVKFNSSVLQSLCEGERYYAFQSITSRSAGQSYRAASELVVWVFVTPSYSCLYHVCT